MKKNRKIVLYISTSISILFFIIFLSYYLLYKYGNYPIIKGGLVKDHIQKMETTLFYLDEKLMSLQTIRPDTPGNSTGRYYINIVNTSDNKILFTHKCDCGLSDVIIHNNEIKIFTSKFLDGKWGNDIYQITLDKNLNIKNEKIIYNDKNGSIYNLAVTEKESEIYLLYESDDSRYGKFSFKFIRIKDDNINFIGIFPINNYKGAPYLKYINNHFYLLYGEYITIKDDKRFKTSIAKSKDLKEWIISDIPFLSPSIFELPCNSDVTIIQKNDNMVLIHYAEADQINTTKLKYATYNGRLEDLFEYYFNKK